MWRVEELLLGALHNFKSKASDINTVSAHYSILYGLVWVKVEFIFQHVAIFVVTRYFSCVDFGLFPPLRTDAGVCAEDVIFLYLPQRLHNSIACKIQYFSLHDTSERYHEWNDTDGIFLSTLHQCVLYVYQNKEARQT